MNNYFFWEPFDACKEADSMQQPKVNVRISVLKKQKASDVGFGYWRDYLNEYILIWKKSDLKELSKILQQVQLLVLRRIIDTVAQAAVVITVLFLSESHGICWSRISEVFYILFPIMQFYYVQN